MNKGIQECIEVCDKTDTCVYFTFVSPVSISKELSCIRKYNLKFVDNEIYIYIYIYSDYSFKCYEHYQKCMRIKYK